MLYNKPLIKIDVSSDRLLSNNIWFGVFLVGKYAHVEFFPIFCSLFFG